MILAFDVCPLAGRNYVISIKYSSDLLRKISKIGKSRRNKNDRTSRARNSQFLEFFY